MTKEKFLVIHCTDTPEGMEVSKQDIFDWHTKPKPLGRAWKQVGYRDMITIGGLVINLVPDNGDNVIDTWELTNGVKGENHHASHLVYVGGKSNHKSHNYPKDTRTREQLFAMRNYIIMKISQNPEILIGGHNQFDDHKACPSFDVPKWLRSIGIPEKNIYKG